MSFTRTVPPPSAYAQRMSEEMFVCSPERSCRSIMIVEDADVFVQRIGTPGGGATVAYWDVGFGRRTSVRVGGDLLWVGDGSRFELKAFSLDGRWRRSVRLSAPARPVTQADIRQYREFELAHSPGLDLAIVRRALEEMPFPRTMPAFESFEVGLDGRLWVKGYPSGGQRDQIWYLFGVTGSYEGKVRLPFGFVLHGATSQEILGSTKDSSGLERVCVIRIVRPDSPSAARFGAGAAAPARRH